MFRLLFPLLVVILIANTSLHVVIVLSPADPHLNIILLQLFLKLNWNLNFIALVLIGALSAGTGRYVLARATRRLRGHLPPKRVASLRHLGERLKGHRVGSVVGIGLFALSPVPSAQLFEGAGLMEVPLIPLTAAFFAGRIVSYSFSLEGASLAARNVGDVMRSSLTSPWGLAIQVGMLGVLVLLARVDWARRLGKR